ncbi:MAG: SRPBCC domain-containing protein [Gammaproteobacteria bacterium]|nr:SRPBCC domain-containing protein [Gammaproteobacteria bacterium]
MRLPKKINIQAAAILITSLSFAGCVAVPAKNIHTSIDIDAPKDKVWAVLVDNSAYPEWNPYHVEVNGKIAIGEELGVVINKPNGETVKIQPHVMRLERLTELTWGGGIEGIFFGEHVFLLSSIDEFRTRLVHKERFSGIAISFASLDSIEKGYDLMNQALKERVEEYMIEGVHNKALSSDRFSAALRTGGSARRQARNSLTSDCDPKSTC